MHSAYLLLLSCLFSQYTFALCLKTTDNYLMEMFCLWPYTINGSQSGYELFTIDHRQLQYIAQERAIAGQVGIWLGRCTDVLVAGLQLAGIYPVTPRRFPFTLSSPVPLLFLPVPRSEKKMLLSTHLPNQTLLLTRCSLGPIVFTLVVCQLCH